MIYMDEKHISSLPHLTKISQTPKSVKTEVIHDFEKMSKRNINIWQTWRYLSSCGGLLICLFVHVLFQHYRNPLIIFLLSVVTNNVHM